MQTRQTEPAGAGGDIGRELHGWVRTLYPLCRSITGQGLRDTLRFIARHIPLTLHEVPSGTPVLDWVVPREWRIDGAWIDRMDGTRLVDFADSTLHVVSYSRPVEAVLDRTALAPHIHTLPDQPALIPYRTGYFAEDWGFCLSHRHWLAMGDGPFHVRIDSALVDGSLSYGELLVPGTDPVAGEILVSVHCCHPSLANDNLSGIAVATALARRCLDRPGRLGVRFLFLPATIGAITWLARNLDRVDGIRHGLVLSCVGDGGDFHYKRSRRGTAPVDRAVAHVLARHRAAGGSPGTLLPFSPYGYDERQYNSPGFDLPVGCFMRSPNGGFPEYHTSADNPDFVRPAALAESLSVLGAVLDLLQADRTYLRSDGGLGEPQLGRRGLYRAIAGQREGGGADRMALLWLLNLADGRHSLLDMAERSGEPVEALAAAADLCLQAGLIHPADGLTTLPQRPLRSPP